MLWLGYYDDTDHHFDGYLDEVSIYARVLSDAEIANLSDNQAGRYEYHHTNALGSNIVLTDDNQNVLVRYEYDVFGAIRSETGTSDNVRKFTGKEWDGDVRLYYYAARYYDPYIGGFTQRDPAKDGINWYAYANNNPLAFIDPSGLRAVNAIERDALIWTFGQEVGEYLADVIDIEVKDLDVAGRVPAGTKNKILLKTGYNPRYNLNNLATFIHEATHIWQRQTGLHRGGKGGEDYDYTWEQLWNLDLDREEHAEAVEDWFFVTYGITTGRLGTVQDGWDKLAKHNLGLKRDRQRDKNSPAWNSWEVLRLVTEINYADVINEIRNPIFIPGLPPQNFPNPAE